MLTSCQRVKLLRVSSFYAAFTRSYTRNTTYLRYVNELLTVSVRVSALAYAFLHVLVRNLRDNTDRVSEFLQIPMTVLRALVRYCVFLRTICELLRVLASNLQLVCDVANNSGKTINTGHFYHMPSFRK